MISIEQLILTYNFEIATLYGRFRASKVQNIEQAVDVEEVHEGGVNNYVHSLVKPTAGGKKLIFERGCCNEPMNAKIASLIGIRQTDPLTILVYGRLPLSIRKIYVVYGWMITKWSLSELDAGESGGVLLEKVEMSYETLKEE